mgnify:CR=1 FL=1
MENSSGDSVVIYSNYDSIKRYGILILIGSYCLCFDIVKKESFLIGFFDTVRFKKIILTEKCVLDLSDL